MAYLRQLSPHHLSLPTPDVIRGSRSAVFWQSLEWDNHSHMTNLYEQPKWLTPDYLCLPLHLRLQLPISDYHMMMLMARFDSVQHASKEG